MAAWNDKEFILQACSMYKERVLEGIQSNISVSAQQKATTKEHAVKGPIWVSKFDIDGPEGVARQLLCKAIDFHAEENGPYDVPEVGRLECHWSGVRSGVDDKNEPEPQISEGQKYEAMTRDAANGKLVVFFVYGGAYYMNGPSAYRKTYLRLAQTTGGRVYCVRQRLAPQHAFPAALLDVLHAYLSLLCPPPGSHHEAVPAAQIVLTADSSGATLAFALLQVLLTIKREGWTDTIRFYGRDVEIALPAGMTAICPVADLTNGLPSYKTNAEHDVFPQIPPTIEDDCTQCEVWPSDPPRGSVYCHLAMLYHPMVSSTLFKDWTGCPPLWLSCGEEQVVDSVRHLAQTALSQGVQVAFSEYQLMPHFWPMVFADSPQSKKMWKEWAQAITSMSRGEKQPSKAVFIHAKDLREEPLDQKALVDFTRDQARAMMVQGTARMKVFTGKDGRLKL